MSLITRIEGTGMVESPEPYRFTGSPQLMLLWEDRAEATVIAYFMENVAFEIVDPHAVAKDSDIIVRYSIRAPDAVAAGVALRKIVLKLRGLDRKHYGLSIERPK